jgi:type I restriction enzyme R subunit
MLLTGFDAKRLKKLIHWPVNKGSQPIADTNASKPTLYKKFRYGYVVDFADIRKEFDATNKAYFDELQAESWAMRCNYSNLFKSKEEIEEEIKDIKEKLFHYDLNNAEVIFATDQPD